MFFEKMRESFTKNIGRFYPKTICIEENVGITVSVSMLMLPIGRQNFVSQEVSEMIFSLKKIAKISKGSFSSVSLI